MSPSLLSPSLLVPAWSTKMEAGREYWEAPATSVTLTLPLWWFHLNWLNELPIWEALVTAYWCVHACVHMFGFAESTDSASGCFSFLPSMSLHICPTTSCSQSTQKFNKLLHGHWSFSHPNICIRKKGCKTGVVGVGGVRESCLFILVEKKQ